MSDFDGISKLLAASQSSVKSRNAVRFARICRLIERDMVRSGLAEAAGTVRDLRRQLCPQKRS
jgi:hypothetical protein